MWVTFYGGHTLRREGRRVDLIELNLSDWNRLIALNYLKRVFAGSKKRSFRLTKWKRKKHPAVVRGRSEPDGFVSLFGGLNGALCHDFLLITTHIADMDLPKFCIILIKES